MKYVVLDNLWQISQENISFRFILFHFILFYFHFISISFHFIFIFISFHFILFHFHFISISFHFHFHFYFISFQFSSFHFISFHILHPACPQWHLGAKFFVIYRINLLKKVCENKRKTRIKRATGQGWQTSRSSIQNFHIIIGIVGNNNSKKYWHISLFFPQMLTEIFLSSFGHWLQQYVFHTFFF